ncbi:hypothetical protein BDW74DRAFT_182102 [Aspergillus multicolor]|uniref:uncharacterized protein n=1 Tax=Aspergillus multicolor TaxID=41759 RepID=UPI003CCDB691
MFLKKMNLILPLRDNTLLQVHLNFNTDPLALLRLSYLGSLQGLALILSSYPADTRTDNDIDGDAALFLANLPPLSSLHISARKDCTMRLPLMAALQHHGQELRRLALEPSSFQPFDLEAIREIQNSCPKLRSLCIRIPRSIGSSPESEFYRKLAALTHLNLRTLVVDCTAMNTRAPDSDSPNAKHQLMNAAIDEAWVRAIFALITSSPCSLLPQLTVGVVIEHAVDQIGDFHRMIGQIVWQIFRALDGVFVHEWARPRRHNLRD